VTSYGAFTYSLSAIFRQIKRQKRFPSFNELVERVSGRLKELKYDQTPALVGPAAKLGAPVSYLASR
jgi:hypothetical protein